MSSPSPTLRKRVGKTETTPVPEASSGKRGAGSPRKSEWDYRLAITIMTVLAFLTRFYRISYPDQVVFDEVHFGKVSGSVDCIDGGDLLTDAEPGGIR